MAPGILLQPYHSILNTPTSSLIVPVLHKMAAVFPLAFPYSVRLPQKVGLTKLVFRDEQDTSRIALGIEDNQCLSITHSYTKSDKPMDQPLRYVSNPLKSLPLLLCIPSSHHRMKLHIDVSNLKTSLHQDHELVIVKNSGPQIENTEMAQLLSLDNWSSSHLEIAKILFGDLVPKDNLNIVIVNDSIQESATKNTVIVSVWEKSASDYDFLLKFDVWIELPTDLDETLNLPKSIQSSEEFGVKDLNVKDLRKAFQFDLQDGPEFRKALNKYEQEAPRIKRALLALQDETKHFEKLLALMQTRKNKIIDIMGVLLDAQFNSLLQNLHVHASFASKFALIFDAFQSNSAFIFEEIFNQSFIAKIATYCNVSLVDSYESSSKKRLFEKQSKEYYDWLNKYLSNEKDRPKLKLLLKRKTFELLKFDYLNSLNLASNNQYFNQFLEHIMKFTNLPVNNGYLNYELFLNSKESQQLLSEKSRFYLNTLSRFNSEKLQLRQMIEACESNEELSSLLKENPMNSSEKKSTDDSSRPRIDTKALDPDLVFPASPIYVSNADLSVVSHDADQNPNISGILYALGGQGKPGWHKEWVVLRNGQLMEFSDWRNGTSPINRPIDVAIASVKPVNHDKRHHCFEIISSSGHKHVFQALNSEERQHWMKALYNAGQITNRLISKSNKHSINQALFTKPLPLGIPRGQGSPVSIFSSTFTTEDDDFLSVVRAVSDSSNDVCADCSSTDSVEWISLNNLVAICVRCSSCHRHMGSHISKVKSLKLDNFRNEQRVLLNYINNNLVNKYLEETVSSKITPDASDEQRLRFIKHKYEHRTFLSPTGDLNAGLVRLVRKIDVPGVVKSLNCGADPNLNIQVSSSSWPEPKTISLFQYSLKKVVEVEVKGEKKDYFVVSELLILNNCKVSSVARTGSEAGLSEKALEFWKDKAAIYTE